MWGIYGALCNSFFIHLHEVVTSMIMDMIDSNTWAFIGVFVVSIILCVLAGGHNRP